MKRTALLAIVVLFCAAGNLSAQTIRGVVVADSTNLPLASAIITLLNSRGQDAGKPAVRSDSLGRFTIHAGDIGRYRVRATRIGYQPVTSGNLTFQFGGHVHDVTLVMSAAPTKLGTVTITGTTRLTNLELLSHVGFDLRRSKGNGKFLDSLQLAAYKVQPSTTILEDVPGLVLNTDRNGMPVITMMRGGGNCAPAIWIDSFRANNSAGFRLLGLGADMVHAVEVYSPMQMPPPSLAGEMGEFAVNTRGSCGLIAVWTKAFVKDQIERAEAKKKME